MRTVPAPDGFEGCVYFVDGARSWQASARPIGATWWTLTGPLFGHAHLIAAEVDERAAAMIRRAVELGMVK